MGEICLFSDPFVSLLSIDMQQFTGIVACFCLFLLGSASATDVRDDRQNLIFITLDGVRYHEIFNGVQKSRQAGEPRKTPILPNVDRVFREQGFVFGDRNRSGGSTMKISNRISLSQPGYRSILTGEFEQQCRSNDCGMIERETVIDRLMDEGLAPQEVATFASWNVIDLCLESRNSRSVKSVAFDSIQGLPAIESAHFEKIVEQARADRPSWGGSRRDQYTFEMGLKYLKQYRPRFLYLSFVDTDEYAHEGDYPGYVRALREFDERFVILMRTLESLGEYGKETSIVITTDHGRGRWFLWKNHSKEWIDSTRVWALVLPSIGLRERSQVERVAKKRYSHVDIRPTLETLLGLSPREARRDRGESLVRISWIR